MPYEEGYEMSGKMDKAVSMDKLSLGQELQRMHKVLAEYDDLLDLAATKLEPFLGPPVPSTGVHAVPSDRNHESPMRQEIWTLINRGAGLNYRLRDLLDRLDV